MTYFAIVHVSLRKAELAYVLSQITIHDAQAMSGDAGVMFFRVNDESVVHAAAFSVCDEVKE